MTIDELIKDLERHPKDMEVVIPVHNLWGWEDYRVADEPTKVEYIGGKGKNMVVIR